jgi:uncharacterized SAM-binding protein YcdF (DUF218 family)
MNRAGLFILCLLILLILGVVQAPSFLIVSDKPVKSDAVVLFLGGEKGTREKEARQLMQEGFAEYLIIPAYHQVKKLSPNGTLVKADLPVTPNHLKPKTASWLEDTHQEAVIARNMMESLGISSALLVSSPYHMLRIKIIADKVFGDSITVQCVPTRHEAPGDDFWIFNSHDRKYVVNEYIKIGWFILYSPFV